MTKKRNKIYFFTDTHDIVSQSVWNRVPHFHILAPGSLAPCIALDVNGGFFRVDISSIFLDFSSQGSKGHMNWQSIQSGLLELNSILRFQPGVDFNW